MRLINKPVADPLEYPDLTPGQAGMAEALMDNPLNRIGAKLELDRLPDSPTLTPPELKAKFPNSTVEFIEPMSEARAALIVERQAMRDQWQKAQNLTLDGEGYGWSSFGGALVGSLLDPIGFAAGAVASAGIAPMARAAGYVGKSLSSKIAMSTVDNFLGNLAVDLPSYSVSRDLKDPENLGVTLGMNLAVSSVFGVGGGLLKHYAFRATPEIAEKLDEIINARYESGGSPHTVETILNEHVAAENSGSFYPYTYEPFNAEKPFFGGSKAYTDSPATSTPIMNADLADGDGFVVFDDPNKAHAGALTAESGNAGAVFEVDIRNMKILDGNTKLSELGYEDTIAATQQAIDATYSIPMPAKENVTVGDLLVQATTNQKKPVITKNMIDTIMYEMNNLNKPIGGGLTLGKVVGRVFKGENNSLATTLRMLKEVWGDHPLVKNFSEDMPAEKFIRDIIAVMKDIDKNRGAVIKGGKNYAAKVPALKAIFDSGELRVTDWPDLLSSQLGDTIKAIRALSDVPVSETQGRLDKVFKEIFGKSPAKFKDINVRTAYREVLKAYAAGKITREQRIAFENSLGADGISFVADNYNGASHTPANAVYFFDKNKVAAKSVQPANPEAVGKLTKERIMKIDIKGQDKPFQFEWDESAGRYRQIIERRKKASKIKPPADDEFIAKSNVLDEHIAQERMDLKQVAEFEGHMSPEDMAQLKNIEAELKLADQMEAVSEKVKACLR